MSNELMNVLEAAMNLGDDDRAELVAELLNTLDDGRDDVFQSRVVCHSEVEQRDEIESRLANMSEDRLIPYDEAMKMAKARKMP